MFTMQNGVKLFKASSPNLGKVKLKNLATGWESPAYDRIFENSGAYIKTCNIDEMNTRLYGVITKNRVICEPKYLDISELVDFYLYQVAEVQGPKGWGLIDLDGNEILPPIYSKVKVRDENICIVGNDKGLYGAFFIRKNKLTPIKYTKFIMHKDFIETYLGDKVGVLLNDCKTEVFPPIFQSVEHFSDDIYMAQTESGKFVLNSPSWKNYSVEADQFFQPANGAIRVKRSSMFGFINTETGNSIKPFLYADATDFKADGFAFVRYYHDKSEGLRFLDLDGIEHDYYKKFTSTFRKA